MNFMRKFKQDNLLNQSWIVIGLSFLIWIFCFRGFLIRELPLMSDAKAYFEHFHYFVDNLARGVYPLWEPDRNSGVSIDLFLRRIGSYNPLFIFFALLVKCGIPFPSLYFPFLALYYFCGMIGFYLLSKEIFKDSHVALFGYLLLMFSSLGTRAFDSFFFACVRSHDMVFLFFYRLCQRSEQTKFFRNHFYLDDPDMYLYTFLFYYGIY